MNTRRFFTESPTVNAKPGSSVTITGDEFHHLKNVNRARSGDMIEVIDGRGALFLCRIHSLKGHEALVDIQEMTKVEKSPCRIVLAPSLLKQRPMGILIEKLTEMGVDEIRPIIFSRTDEKYNPGRLKKWQKVALQSLKVNKRLWITDIFEPEPLPEFLKNMAQWSGTKILLDIASDDRALSFQEAPVITVIGPPGDFTEEERQLLVKKEFMRYNISDAVLKSETAALSVAAILKHAFNTPGAYI